MSSVSIIFYLVLHNFSIPGKFQFSECKLIPFLIHQFSDFPFIFSKGASDTVIIRLVMWSNLFRLTTERANHIADGILELFPKETKVNS